MAHHISPARCFAYHTVWCPVNWRVVTQHPLGMCRPVAVPHTVHIRQCQAHYICCGSATSTGSWRRAITISATCARGSVADRSAWARVQQATQGRRGAQLAAQKEPLPLPGLWRNKQKARTCKEDGRAKASPAPHPLSIWPSGTVCTHAPFLFLYSTKQASSQCSGVRNFLPPLSCPSAAPLCALAQHLC